MGSVRLMIPTYSTLQEMGCAVLRLSVLIVIGAASR